MREIITFGAVGAVATLTHYGFAIVAIEALGIDVLWSNLLAYLVAVGISFLGHARLTFRATLSRTRFVRFIATSLSALLLSQSLLWLLTTTAWFGHRINMLAVVCVIPCYTYLLSKFWVYRRN